MIFVSIRGFPSSLSFVFFVLFVLFVLFVV